MTDRYALFGNPAKHAAYARASGQDLSHEVIEAPVDGFAAAVTVFRTSSDRGGNVTMPFKLEAFALDRSLGARPSFGRGEHPQIRGRAHPSR